MAAENGLDDIYNVGTGERYSFNTLVEMLNEELGMELEPEYLENPIPEDVYVHDTCADASKLQESTGWEPKMSFEEGIEQLCKPYKQTVQQN